MSRNAPLCLYVAWHSKCRDAPFLAREIFRWFRGDPYDIEACATGIPVLFRAWTETSKEKRPLDLPNVEGGVRVVVLLIDEHFVTSTQWRAYVHRLVGRSKSKAKHLAGRTIVLPVALHAGAFQFTEDVATLNFLRPDGATVPPGESDEDRRKRRATRLRTQLTESLGRLLLAKNQGFDIDQFGRPPEKVSVFLSHAKADGADKALLLRDEIQRRGQLEVFFDENDLAYGFDYQRGLNQALLDGNAALLAVLSDRYASRPWCRHELRTMRRVQQVEAPSKNRAGVCKLSPVVVVDALEHGSSDHLPELGPAPVLRWQADRGPLIVDRVLREVLHYAHDLQRAVALSTRIAKERRPRTWLINGPPDLGVIAEIRLLAKKAGQEEARLLFPGPGITRDSREEWSRLFPEVTCESFDDVEVQP